jgi:very-short-patch-repair endonuclease
MPLRITAALDVPDVARRQAGAFTRAQAYAEGMSRSQVARRVSSGGWTRLTGQALVARDVESCALTQVWAVYLTWPDAVASHLTAARFHRFPLAHSGSVHATVPRSLRSIGGLTAHRLPLDAFEIWDVTPDRGPRVTSPTRTALDCLRSLDREAGLSLLAWLVARQVLSRDQLAAVLVDDAGSHGSKRLYELFRRTAGDALSEAERVLHAALRRAGLVGWAANVRVRDATGVIAVVDILFAAQRLVIEIDGWAAHGNRDAFENDRRRQNRLVNAGYVVLRFTWNDITHRESEVLGQIRVALKTADDQRLSSR